VLGIQALGDAEHAAPGVRSPIAAHAADDVLAHHDHLGSRAISWSSASLIACFMLILRAMVGVSSVFDVDVGQQVGLRRQRRGLGLGDGASSISPSTSWSMASARRPSSTPALGDAGGNFFRQSLIDADVVELAGRAVGLRVALEVAGSAPSCIPAAPGRRRGGRAR
jgi:hypothetical protein